MNRNRSWLLACLVFNLCAALFAASPPPKHLPIQAELVGRLDAGRVKIGDSVFAKVTVQWEEKPVTLEAGTILCGRVVALDVSSKTHKNSQLALFFDGAENSRKQTFPLRLTLAAVLAPDDSERNSSEYQSLTEAPGVVLQAGNLNPMRSVLASADTVYYSPRRDPKPVSVLPGQVVGIRGLKLSVGAGPEGSSVLYATGKNVRLDTGSRLAFVRSENDPSPSSISGPAPTSADNTSSVASSGAADASDLDEDQTDICTPLACSVALPADNTEATAALPIAARSIVSLRELGYIPPATHEMSAFGYDSAITYLGPRELLFTFNPHVLVRRSKAEAGLPKLHSVRAVLIDAETMKVERSVDWKVHDANQYLWSAGSGRVLVHVGFELRLYGPHLKPLLTLPLDGPLAFVTMSPSRTYFAVGTVRERHSADVHEGLAEAEGRAPEEDIEVQVVNAEFHVLATIMETSRSVPPVLSDQGEIGTIPLSRGRWRISEHTWDGQKRVVAKVNSTCRPQMTTLPPNRLFVVGCDRKADGRWYRILRPDGKPVLKGWSPSAELEHAIVSSATGDLYAVSIVKSARSLSLGSVFESGDLESQLISVYQVKNGERLSNFRIPGPAPSKQTFELTPKGEQLAVLTGDRISFFAVARVANIQ